MQRIVPHLWFDTQAEEAAKFYASVFPNSAVESVVTLHNTPGGDSVAVSFNVNGYRFQAISAGPLFTINPSISFMVNFDPSKLEDAEKNLRYAWANLSGGGEVLMPLDSYPFSPLYGWTQDRYGVSWQLMMSAPEGGDRPFITPALMFVGDLTGKAEEATDFYLSVFEGAERGVISRYEAGQGPDVAGTVNYTDFTLEGQWFAAMDSALEHQFSFNEAVSLLVNCDSQDEIDRYWQRLSAVPEAEQCGWLKDKYGVSWQITSSAMDEMLVHGTPEQVDRVTQAFLPMKKLDVKTLEDAYHGR